MKSPFKKSNRRVNQEPEQRLSDIQFVAEMQHKIDDYERMFDSILVNLTSGVSEGHIQDNVRLCRTNYGHRAAISLINYLFDNHLDILKEWEKNSKY